MPDVVVIGGSAGALDPLRQLLRGFPGPVPASFFVVIHSSPDTPGMLPTLLASCTTMPVAFASNGDAIAPGHVYVAPRDHHLLLHPHHVAVTRGPRENGFRPAVDPLFRTAADVFGPRVIGVVLSGGLDDGTRGLAAIKAAGGLAVVQKLDEVFAVGMPASAIRNVAVDHVVPAAELGAVVHRLVHEDRRTREEVVMTRPESDPEPAARGLHALKDGAFPGPPTTFTCPECGGTLWEVANRNLSRFACHVGHSYTPDALANGMATTLEAALWTAMRVLEENAEFLRRMQKRASDRNLETIAQGYEVRIREVEARAAIVRSALVDEIVPRDAEASRAASTVPVDP